MLRIPGTSLSHTRWETSISNTDDNNAMTTTEIEDASTFKPSWGRLSGSLSEIQQRKMEQLWEEVKEYAVNNVHGDPMLSRAMEEEDRCKRLVLRFLRARDFDVEAAQRLFIEVVEWRKSLKSWEYGVELIQVPKACWHFRDTKGFDKKGRPLLYARASYLDRKIVEKDAFFAACVAMCEHTMRIMKGNVDQFSTIYDCEGFSLLTNLPLAVLHKMFVTLQSYYPELLGKVWLVNFSAAVHLAYKMVSPFIDKHTKSKIIFVEDNGEDILKQEIDSKHLPKWLGGTSDFEFD